ncbi:MAG: hypothetical protein ACRD2G_17730 [Terriglobia bacterium]
MRANLESQASAPAQAQVPSASENQQAALLRHLQRILNSHAFRTSERSKQFLSYVVEQALQGRVESLKERTIGVELFHRPPMYLTGDDPVVRVKAGEVRRRLAQYYAEEEPAPDVRITIPVGSYVPEFEWGPVVASIGPTVKAEAFPAPTPALRTIRRFWKFGLVAAGLAVLALALVKMTARHAQPPSALDEFWQPLFTTSQPVLICLASPVVYQPDLSLYERVGRAHPGQYASEVERYNVPLQLDPSSPLQWKDMQPDINAYVNKDDAYVAADLSALFARIHKVSQVRAGQDFSYDDLRNSPAVLIGAFNNAWTMRMTSNLPFAFREQNSIGWIQEQGEKGRIWRPVWDGQGHVVNKDFALVARLLDSETGEIVVVVAGVGGVGTQAAGGFVSRESALETGLRAAPAGWQKKNLEMVVESDVIEGAAGPPRVVAATAW